MATLYLVGTPIGNLEDISQRALRVLREVDLIAAEDTRVTRRLLARYGIETPLVCYTDAYQRRKAARLQQVLMVLEEGRDVALVSDAGLPGLSDPGYELISAALAAGHRLVVVPGPSAITTALLASGLPSNRFLFVGFLPRRATARRKLLAGLKDEPGTLVAFEAPHRLTEALADALAVLGDRPVAVARELTKQFEEVWHGSLAGALEHFRQQPARGEITLVIGGSKPTGDARPEEWSSAQVTTAVELLLREGLAPSSVARVVARLSGWRRSEVYALLTQQS